MPCLRAPQSLLSVQEIEPATLRSQGCFPNLQPTTASTPPHQTQGLTWPCCEGANRTLEDNGQHVPCFDESRCQLLGADGKASCQQGTVQTGGGFILVWGVFSWHGLAPLVSLNTLLTRAGYVSLLGGHWQRFMDYPYCDGLV